jgi:hypothetical protein
MALLKTISKLSLIATLLSIPCQNANAQTTGSDIANASKITGQIHHDGKLTEHDWLRAPKISGLKQREPAEGAHATEKTEIAILYDTHNIYFGIWCYDSNMAAITAKQMKRDFSWGSDDNIEIMISPFNDNRNGYSFITNPNGAMADSWLGGDGGSYNTDWNGVWDVKVTTDNKGWYVEMVIPFSTLKFKKEQEQVWSFNIERNIRRKNEQVTWQGWSRQYEISNITQSGKIHGLENIRQKEKLEVLPYITTGIEFQNGQDNSQLKIGGELNYDISPTMKLNFTINTDFAQVESDRQEVNLSRFSIYYPEKRQFFLEGRSYFDMSVSGARLFYSRRIGIEDGDVVPVLGGGRLFGKVNKTSIGILNLQTGSLSGTASSNSSVIRIKQDIFKESGIGFITTQKFSNGKYNAVYGTDFTYNTSSFMGNKNLMTGFSAAMSVEQDNTANPTEGKNKDNATYHVFFFYPNDIWSFNAGFNSIQENFTPELGFVNRDNFKRFYSRLQFEPRVKKEGSVIRNFSFELYDIEYYINDKTGKAETFQLEARPLGIDFQSGDYIGISAEYNQDRPLEEFDLIDNVLIPSGKYDNLNFGAEFHSYDARTITFGAEYETGTFYTGNRNNFSSYIELSLSKHVNIGADWDHNTLDMPQGVFKVNEIGGRINYALNPHLNSSLFAQWNNQSEDILLNYRINWIPKIGSFFYFVVNQSISTKNKKFKLTRTTILGKLVWRFAI